MYIALVEVQMTVLWDVVENAFATLKPERSRGHRPQHMLHVVS